MTTTLGLVVGALAVMHFLLHVGFGVGGAAPDLLTVALLLGAREMRPGWASGLGLVFGVLEDALSVVAFGANAVAMTLVATAGARSRELFVGDSLIFAVSYFFIGKWLRDIVHWFLVGDELRRPFLEQVVLNGMAGAAYAAVVGVAILLITGMSTER
jgi:rod shape-determining protein MreD